MFVHFYICSAGGYISNRDFNFYLDCRQKGLDVCVALLLRFADSYSTCHAQQYVPARQCRGRYRISLRNHKSFIARQAKDCVLTASRRHHEQRNLLNVGRRRPLGNRYTRSCFGARSRGGDFQEK